MTVDDRLLSHLFSAAQHPSVSPAAAATCIFRALLPVFLLPVGFPAGGGSAPTVSRASSSIALTTCKQRSREERPESPAPETLEKRARHRKTSHKRARCAGESRVNRRR